VLQALQRTRCHGHFVPSSALTVEHRGDEDEKLRSPGSRPITFVRRRASPKVRPIRFVCRQRFQCSFGKRGSPASTEKKETALEAGQRPPQTQGASVLARNVGQPKRLQTVCLCYRSIGDRYLDYLQSLRLRDAMLLYGFVGPSGLPRANVIVARPEWHARGAEGHRWMAAESVSWAAGGSRAPGQPGDRGLAVGARGISGSPDASRSLATADVLLRGANEGDDDGPGLWRLSSEKGGCSFPRQQWCGKTTSRRCFMRRLVYQAWRYLLARRALERRTPCAFP